MIDHRCYKISIRALQPHGYTVKVFDAINRPMSQMDMPELFFKDGVAKVFPDYGLAVHTAKQAIDRLQSTPMKKADPVMANEGLRQIVNEQSKTILAQRQTIKHMEARIAELEAENANHRKQWDNAIGLFDAIESKLGHEKYSALLVSIIDDDKGEVK
jgi:hypothetical protein